MADGTFDLAEFPVHLGLGARVVPLDRFEGTPDWYERYGASTAADGEEGRLVTIHSFSESWTTWEMHPKGDELVLCVEGSIVLHQEDGDERRTVELHAGEAVINSPGVWHTADVTDRATAVFITAGMGTEVRPR
jgi:uncharacterized cupin superfamily protein